MQFLPGVFEQSTYPKAIKGSLWALPYEVVMYLMLGVIGLLVAISTLTQATKHIFFWLLLFLLRGQSLCSLNPN